MFHTGAPNTLQSQELFLEGPAGRERDGDLGKRAPPKVDE